MRKGLRWVVGICLLGASPLAAQTVTAPSARGILLEPRIPAREEPAYPDLPLGKLPPPPPLPASDKEGVRQVTQFEGPPPAPLPATTLPRALPQSVEPPSTIMAQPALVDFSGVDGAYPYRVWGGADYLLWRVRNAPLPRPLVTTGNPLDASPGAVGQPGTSSLLSDSLRYGSLSGVNATFGFWLNDARNVGFEASGFLLQNKTSTFTASSNSSGSPLLAFPFYNQTPGAQGERSIQISNPAFFVGSPLVGNVTVASTLQLWGADANTLFCLWSTPGFEFHLLAGARYADLNEALHIANASSDYSTSPSTYTVVNDHFNTRNQFYGGQLGTRLSWQRNGFSLDLTAKAALGITHQVLTIQGDTTQTGPASLTLPYGLFTEPSNRGRYTANQFTVLPSAQARVGYQLTRWMGVYAGYSALYWNQVVRPGNQMDRGINLSQNQNPTFNPAGGGLVGPASPAPQFNRSDFWAQGMTFGVEFHY